MPDGYDDDEGGCTRIVPLQVTGRGMGGRISNKDNVIIPRSRCYLGPSNRPLGLLLLLLLLMMMALMVEGVMAGLGMMMTLQQ